MRIGLTLSGGGFRAIVFHLGVLGRLAADQRLEDIEFLSTVSGGSLCAALVFAANNYQWPSSPEFWDVVMPHAHQLLTEYDLQRNLTWRTLRTLVTTFRHDARDFSKLIQTRWGITASLQDLPDTPRWIINATTHETGKRWRFEKKRMADWRLDAEVRYPDFPLSEAVVASAAAPPGIGAVTINTAHYAWVPPGQSWEAEPEPVNMPHKRIHLWDGALYDNLGTEALFKRFREPKGGQREFDFLLVSDASLPLKIAGYRWGWKMGWRLYEITANQSQALRTRGVMDYFKTDPTQGRYLKLGNKCSYVLGKANRKDEVERLCPKCLPDDQIAIILNMGMTARRLSSAEFERLFRHGFEVADYTLYAYGPDTFNFMGYEDYRGGIL